MSAAMITIEDALLNAALGERVSEPGIIVSKMVKVLDSNAIGFKCTEDSVDGVFQGLDVSILHGLTAREKLIVEAAKRKPSQGGGSSRGGPSGAGPSQAAGMDRTYTFLKGLRLVEVAPSYDQLKEVLGAALLHKDGTKVRLPVADDLCDSFVQQDAHLYDMIEPVSTSKAHTLSALVTAALSYIQSEPDDEITVASNMDCFVDRTFALMARAFQQLVKRKRNRADDSLTQSRLRPGYMLLALDVLMFKEEDKPRSGSLDAAAADLVSKMKDWSDTLNNRIEYLLCAAYCGFSLRFAALKRGDKIGVHWLGDVLDTSSLHGRVQAIMCSMVLFGIIMQQRQQLPETAIKLGRTISYHDGNTIITMMDGYIQKQVKAGPWLTDAEVSRLKRVYEAVHGHEYVVNAVDPPRRSRTYYEVSVRPLGTSLSGPPTSSLKAAIRCWLKGLDALHTKAACGHGDVRWPNLIQISQERFCIIDLEGSVQLNSKPEPPHPVAWCEGEALVRGRYTQQSDLWQLGRLLAGVVPADDELGKQLVKDLLSKKSKVEKLLAHGWFSDDGAASGSRGPTGLLACFKQKGQG